MNKLFSPRPALTSLATSLLGTVLLWSASATAVVLPDVVLEALERQDNAYVQQPGFTAVDLDATVLERHYELLARRQTAAELAEAAVSASAPDHDLHPVERALRLLTASDGELPRARYHIEYRLVTLPEHDYWAPRAHIQVTRFNLGPLQHQALAAALGAENVAPAAEFGLGPHVRWRFVMAPTQNLIADLTAVSRQTLSAAAAASADCLGTPCLSSAPVEGPATGWRTLEAAPFHAPPVSAGFSDAAAAAGILAATALGPANLGYGEPVETPSASAPQLVLVVTAGAASDEAVDALAHEPMVMDDAIAELWLRRTETRASTDWNQLPVYRPGRN